MNKEEQNRLREAEEEVIRSRVAQSKAQKERDALRRDLESLKGENKRLNDSLKDNEKHVDDLNNQIAEYNDKYSEVWIDLNTTRSERDVAHKVLQEIVDKFGGNKIPGRLKQEPIILETIRKAQQVLVGEKPDPDRPTPTQRKRALQEKRKARLSK